MSELNDIKVPSAGEPEWRGEITDGKLDQIRGGLLIPNQGFSKAMAREIKELRVREAAHKAERERAKEDAAESDAKIRDILCVLLSNLPYSQVEAIRTKCEEATRTRLQAERGKDGVKDGD